MADRMKLVLIGAGSTVFTQRLVADLILSGEFHRWELALVDIDPVTIKAVDLLVRKMLRFKNADFPIVSTTDRCEVLPGADFVVTSVAVDRLASWRTDHELALKHGFGSVLSENGGPGGLSHTLRSIPLMVEIGCDVERLAPNALLLNYTNPENRVCLALRRHASVRSIGLRHSVAGEIEFAARLLGRDRTDIDAHAAGSNHFTWFLSIRDARDGTDLMPELRRRMLAPDSGTSPLRRLLLERFGVPARPDQRGRSWSDPFLVRTREAAPAQRVRWANLRYLRLFCPDFADLFAASPC